MIAAHGLLAVLGAAVVAGGGGVPGGEGAVQPVLSMVSDTVGALTDDVSGAIAPVETAVQPVLSIVTDTVGALTDALMGDQWTRGNAIEALVALGPRAKRAIPALENFIKSTGSTKTAQYAGYLLGTDYEETGNADKAQKAYERALALYPSGEFSSLIRGRLKRLASQRASAQVTPAPSAPSAAAQVATPKP